MPNMITLYTLKMMRVFCILLIFKGSFAQSENAIWQQKNFAHSSGFIQNKGQVKDQNGKARPDVLYIFSEENFNLVLKSDGFSYELFRYDEEQSISEATGLPTVSNDYDMPEIKVTVQRSDAFYIGGSSTVEVVAEGESLDYFNFYQGRGESTIQVYSYQKITYRNIYPNIDLVFLAPDKENKALRYEYIVHKGGDVDNIKVRYDALDGIKDEGNSVKLPGRFGFVREENLFSYQQDRNHSVSSEFVVNGNILSFKVGSYDPQATLVIDPDIVWGTYYGTNSAEDKSKAVVVDPEGNLVLTGQTASKIKFATTGAYQTTFQGDPYDAFIMKWGPSGNRIWVTYYGGNDQDLGFSIHIDANLNIYCAGDTRSDDIVMVNAHQPAFSGNVDVFFLKMNKNGSLIWSTYYGGSDEDHTNGGLTGDLNGNIYLCGWTFSTTNIATDQSYQPVKANTMDAFLAKFDGSGDRIWATYYGGGDEDRAHSIVVDKDNKVIMSGTTPSLNGIATSNAHQPVCGGQLDIFVVKFSSQGARLWGTYYGGSSDEHGREANIDPEGNIYISGYSASENNIATSDAYQPSWSPAYFGSGNPKPDAMYAKFDQGGNRLYGTYLGGNDEDYGRSLKIQEDGSVILAGSAKSPGLGTNGVFQESHSGDEDVFISKFKPNGMLDWFTYYGGLGDDEGQEIDIDEDKIYITGDVRSQTGIATPGAFKAILTVDSVRDCMIAKFIDRCFDRYEPNNTPINATLINVPSNKATIIKGEIDEAGDTDYYTFSTTAGIIINIQLTNVPLNYDIYLYAPNGQLIGQSVNLNQQNEQLIYSSSETGNYTIQVKSKNSSAFSDVACYELTIYPTSCSPPPATITVMGSLDLCVSGQVQLQANSGNNFTYQWTKGATIINGATKKNYVATTPGSYKVTVTNSNGCSKTSAAVTVTESCKTIAEEEIDPTINIYPNPGNGDFFVNIPSVQPETQGLLRVKNILGQTVFTAKLFFNTEIFHENFELSNVCQDGIYIVLITVDGKTFSRLLTIAK